MEGLTFYRCQIGGHVVSVWDIQKGGCQKCGCRKVVPTDLNLWEKIVQIVKHPKVWEWPEDELTNDL